MFLRGSFALFILCTLLANVISVSVPFITCPDEAPASTAFELDFNCEGGVSTPCTLIKGKTYAGNITFTPKTTINAGQIFLYDIAGEEKLPFPFDKSDFCKGHNLNCPLPAGQKQVFKMELAVPSFAPPANYKVEIEVRPPKSSASLMCLQFLVTIADKSNDIEA